MLKIHSVLAAYCVKNNLSEPYLLWVIARMLSAGQGRLSVRLLMEIYIKLFSVSKRTAYNHLNKGFNIFYLIVNHEIYLKSITEICKKVSPIIKISACFEIDTHMISDYHLKPKQLLINCVLGADVNGKPLSLSYISRVLNCDKSTITRNIHPQLLNVKTNLNPNKQNLFKFWSSYIFIGGRRLNNKKEKPEIKRLRHKKTADFKLVKNQKGAMDSWEIVAMKTK